MDVEPDIDKCVGKYCLTVGKDGVKPNLCCRSWRSLGALEVLSSQYVVSAD